MTSAFLSVGAAAGLGVVHLAAGRLRFLDTVPRSRWLSAGGGISVAYVLVHVLPELSEAQESVGEAAGSAVPFLERHAYLAALAGLAVFYGVERSSRRSRAARRHAGEDDVAGGPAFWLSIVAYATYNALVGYLLVHRIDQGAQELALFSLAMAVHFVVNDHGLYEHHRHLYRNVGRWPLGIAPLVGVAAGLTSEISEAALGLVFAFLAGGVILNVLKEELPEDRESRFLPFALAAAAYAAVLLAI